MHREVFRAVRRLVFVCSFALAAGASAQQISPAIDPAEAEAKRQAFFEALRNGAAEGEGIGIVPVPRFGTPGPEGVTEGGDGVGIVRVEEAEFARQGTIQYEVAIIHLASPEDFTAEEQAVSGERVDQALQNLRVAGKLAQMSTFRLTSLDLHEASVQIGQQIPVVTARSAPNDRGVRSQAVNYQQFGTLAVVTGRIDGAKIVIECKVEESRLETTERLPLRTVPTLGGADTAVVQGDELNPPSLQKVNNETVLSVADGEKVIVSASFQKTEEGSSATIITLKASILP